MGEQEPRRKRVSRTEPAQSPTDAKGELLARYLRRYWPLEGFRQDFKDLVEAFRLISPLWEHDIVFAGYDEHGPDVARTFKKKSLNESQNLHQYCEQIPTLKDFAGSVTAFAKRWSLDNLADDRGCSILYATCWYQVDCPPYVEKDMAVACAALYDEVLDDGHFVSEMNRVRDELYHPHDTKLAVHVEMEWTADWITREDMTKLLQQKCEQQIREQIDAALVDLEDRGYIFPAAQPTALDQHLDWLFRRVYHRESPEKIAVSENGMNEEVIRKQTRRLSELLEITIPPSK